MLAGRYRVGELIGRGGMADVHKGVDTRLGRTVAIKLLKPSLATDPAFRTRFRQEAQAAARMAHPTIVRVFDAGEETVRDAMGNEVQAPFIVMEYVDGALLKDILRKGPLDPAEAARIATGLLTALEYSHRAGVVHRDIKPGNVMITRAGQVKVMDFGIARAISDSSATVAQTTAILGTASYFSPEQAKGETVDARTDLYSTGVVLFEMLTGRTPFRGDTAVAVAYQHVSEQPVKPSSINPHVSPAFDMVVMRALAKDRYQRYQSAAEFRDDLELAASGKVPVHKKRDAFDATLFGETVTSPTPTEAALRQLADDEQAVRTQNRPPVLWIWAGVLCVAVIIAALLLWVFSQTPTQHLADISAKVPAVAGLTEKQASHELKDVKLVPKVVDESSTSVAEGKVIRSNPGSGVIASKGDTVTLYVSTGAKSVTVPNVAGKSVTDAQKMLQDAGLNPGQITQQDNPTVPLNVVISTDPASGASAHEGDTVNFIVSNGQVTLPDLTGKSVQDATAALHQLGLVPDAEGDPSCTTQTGAPVNHQNQAPGPVSQGSTVTFTYCTG
ncbi:Stk1 family PASTA domain-containing Ser/Thr kinase [Humibacter ginsenosidimutans]|uniref:non-specific serine/threonine protein kinase n=2 Tax=Humibacter ginsenosidimutans TaxID=2599293 RepID=A0A5B8M830_9MICO|nr:Stk1 family PASTA domain-containing Ser/Thr kinase [Humibacter ginsenosidimutans]